MAYDPYASPKKASADFNKSMDFGSDKVTFLKYKEATDASLFFIPYKIASAKHPAVHDKKAKIGDESIRVDYFVHKGYRKDSPIVLCPKSTYGKPCPFCEAAEIAKKEHGFQSDEYKALKPKARTLFNVVDANDPTQTVKVLDEVQYFFTTPLDDFARARGRKKGVEILKYADPDEKYVVDITVTMDTFNGSKTPKYKITAIEKDIDGVDDKALAKAYPLDKYLNVMSYEDLQNILYGNEEGDEDEDGDEPEESPAPKRTRREEPEVEEAPRARRSRPEPDDDEDDGSGIDTKPVVKKKTGPECPHDMEYGVDFSAKNEKCLDCDLFVGCKKATKALQEM